ncbi:MAG TPA: DciA family protein [Opitutaceae bacterium]
MAEKQPFEFSKLAEELIGDLRGVPFEVPRRQVKRATKPMAGLVEELLHKHQIGRDSPEQTIRDHWRDLVGAANAHYSHAAQIDPRGRLLVLASHSVVRNELFLHRLAIVERIRKLPGCNNVRELMVRTG